MTNRFDEISLYLTINDKIKLAFTRELLLGMNNGDMKKAGESLMIEDKQFTDNAFNYVNKHTPKPKTILIFTLLCLLPLIAIHIIANEFGFDLTIFTVIAAVLIIIIIRAGVHERMKSAKAVLNLAETIDCSMQATNEAEVEIILKKYQKELQPLSLAVNVSSWKTRDYLRVLFALE